MMNRAIKRVLFAGGGTGGHLFPGLAVAEELRRRDPEVAIAFAGTGRGIESRVLPQRGEQLLQLEVLPLRGKNPVETLRSLLAVPGAMLEARKVLKRFKPDLVIGLGGYVAGPLVLQASMSGLRTALLEQNAVLGLTNRMLLSRVGRAYLSFPGAVDEKRSPQVRTLGNPLRRELVAWSQRAVFDPEGFEARARTLLVIGGSQGARILNRHVPKSLSDAGVGGQGKDWLVVHQTGSTMQDEVREKYAAFGIRAKVLPFIDDMADAYARAALVIARAGATTVAELCSMGRPSVLVPFAAAAGDHQRLNAEALERAGASACVLEEQIELGLLTHKISELLRDRAQRLAMAQKARRFGHPDAAASIVDDLNEWVAEPCVRERTGRGFLLAPAALSTGIV